MAYSFNLITLSSECDSLTRIAERDKRNILARQQTLSVRAENSADEVQNNASQLVLLNAQVAAFTAAIAGMPDGPEKQKQVTKKMDAEVHIRKLNEGDTTPVSHVEREYDIALMDAEVAKMDDFIAAVAAHKATL